MSKLIYVHNADERLTELLVRTLQENGYSINHADVNNMSGLERVHIDVAFVCRHDSAPNRLVLGDFTLDLDGVFAYTASGRHIHFTPTEFAMLAYLMKNSQRAVPRSELLPCGVGLRKQRQLTRCRRHRQAHPPQADGLLDRAGNGVELRLPRESDMKP